MRSLLFGVAVCCLAGVALAHEPGDETEEAPEAIDPEHAHVRVEVPGAAGPVTLLVDGEPMGQAPVQDLVLSASVHDLEIQDDCWKGKPVRVALLAGRPEIVEIAVEPWQRRLEVVASGPRGELAGATVRVDGVEVGVTPGTFDVSVCATTVAVSANSMAPWKTEIGRNTDRVVADLRSERRDRAGIPIVGTGGGALLRKPVKVIYPQAAKDRGVGGVVSVRILIDERGKVVKRSDERCRTWDDGSDGHRSWHRKLCAWGTGPTELFDVVVAAYLKAGFRPYVDPEDGASAAWITARTRF